MNWRLGLLLMALGVLGSCGDSGSNVCSPTALPQVCVPSHERCCSPTSNVPYCRDGQWICPQGQILGSCQAVGGTLPRCGPAPDTSTGG